MMTNVTDMAFILIVMGQFIREIGLTIDKREMELKNILTELYIEVNFKIQ